MEFPVPKMAKSVKWKFISGELAWICMFLLLIGILTHSAIGSPLPADEGREITKDEAISAALLGAFDSEEIKRTLHSLTKEPHQAGTEANLRVAETIADIWRENGLEDVHFNKYRVLLNYPNWDEPNHVTLLDSEGQVVFNTSGLSEDLNPKSPGEPEADNYARIQWLAYSANGTVEGEPVYCHYGTTADFELLKAMKISVEGKIAIMRYHEDFRGDKVQNAYLSGAIGAILFTDPMEFAREGTDNVYPKSAWMPSNDVQRGSLLKVDGDPLSPILPSRADLFPGLTRNLTERLEILPKIPAIPIGYADAYEIMRRMGGTEAPKEWQGAMNCTYRIGPGFAQSSTTDEESDDADEHNSSDFDEEKNPTKIRVEVHSNFEIRQIQNVVGYLYGEDRDSWVILGNHYDAWVYGSLDPNSGTAIMAEVARVLTSTSRSQNWRPKRTIMFCAWDAEEFGLIGSSEFVQEFADILRDRAVAYLNVDLIQNNETLVVDSVPSMYQVAKEAAQKVPDPHNRESTIYDTWFKHFPSEISWLPDTPYMGVPSGGSDHMQFLNFLGIPVIDISYRNKSFESYPLYHSMYEVPYVNEHIIDTNNLAVHCAVGQYWAELARTLADSPILPVNATIFACRLQDNYTATVETAMEGLQVPAETIENARQQLSNLVANIEEFRRRSQEIDEQSKLALARNDEKMINRINQRLQKIDQCFVNPTLGMAARGIPERRNVLYSLSDDDSYKGNVMASVHSVIKAIEKEEDESQRKALGLQLAYEIAVVQNSVQCAVNTLQDYI